MTFQSLYKRLFHLCFETGGTREVNLYLRESLLHHNPQIYMGSSAVMVVFVFPLQVCALMSFACSGWTLISPSLEKDSFVIQYKQSLTKDTKWMRIRMIKNKFLLFCCSANKAHRWFTCLAACLNTIKSQHDLPSCVSTPMSRSHH